MARRVADQVLRPLVRELDALTDPWECFQRTRPAVAKLAELGFLSSSIPTEYGGGGMGCLDLALAAEELCLVDVGVPSTVLASGLGLQPIVTHGTASQKERFLRPFAADKSGDFLASFAFTDQGGGANFDSDDPAAGVRTVARREGDFYVVNGVKHFASNGSGWDRKGAHLYTVVARTDLSRGARESLSVIAVPGSAPGIRVGTIENKLGHRLTVQPEVIFEDVRVPADHRIGAEGDGIEIVKRAFGWTAALIGAACVGVMRAAFEHALDFARSERRLGSVPILDHQAVGYALADIKMRIEACRYLTWRACAYVDAHGEGQEVAVMTKVFCSETAVQCVYDAMRVVGIESYVKDHPLERHLRDAVCFPLYDGGNMGVRRRQLHEILRTPGYDSMIVAEDRELAVKAGYDGQKRLA